MTRKQSSERDCSSVSKRDATGICDSVVCVRAVQVLAGSAWDWKESAVFLRREVIFKYEMAGIICVAEVGIQSQWMFTLITHERLLEHSDAYAT
jgi:hypothetical protein